VVSEEPEKESSLKNSSLSFYIDAQLFKQQHEIEIYNKNQKEL
jgi:hypothetical protein